MDPIAGFEAHLAKALTGHILCELDTVRTYELDVDAEAYPSSSSSSQELYTQARVQSTLKVPKLASYFICQKYESQTSQFSEFDWKTRTLLHAGPGGQGSTTKSLRHKAPLRQRVSGEHWPHDPLSGLGERSRWGDAGGCRWRCCSIGDISRTSFHTASNSIVHFLCNMINSFGRPREAVAGSENNYNWGVQWLMTHFTSPAW